MLRADHVRGRPQLRRRLELLQRVGGGRRGDALVLVVGLHVIVICLHVLHVNVVTYVKKIYI